MSWRGLYPGPVRPVTRGPVEGATMWDRGRRPGHGGHGRPGHGGHGCHGHIAGSPPLPACKHCGPPPLSSHTAHTDSTAPRHTHRGGGDCSIFIGRSGPGLAGPW